MKHLTLHQIAGQRLMVGFDGTDLNADLKYLIDTLKVGGIILFKRNIESPDQVKELCLSAQAYARSCGQPPLFIAIDQEGGKVARLSPPFTQFPGNPFLKSQADAAAFAETTAVELNQIGVNMNFAPVMDVAPKDMDSIMEDRVFGDNPEWVALMGTQVIRTLQSGHIMAVAKHFPGIGRTTLDSHLERPIFDADFTSMDAFDLIPFKASISAGVSGIMLSHILYTGLDDKWPASLSRKIAGDLLRNQLGYTGLVMTDDLDMGAIKKHYDLNTAIAQILNADIDLILICHASPDIENAFNFILEHFSEPSSREKSESSLKRITSAKQKYLGYGVKKYVIR